MIPTTSAPIKCHSPYSTELRILDPILSSILHMAQNIFSPAASKRLSAFWLSDKCLEVRKATFQAHFFTKLNIEPNFIPSFIREKLIPEEVQVLVHQDSFRELYPTDDNTPQTAFQGCLGLHKAIQNADDIMPQLDIMLDGIHQREKAKDWMSSYFLAYILGTSRLSESLHNYDRTTNASVTRQFLPFSSWLILLHNPNITEHLLVIFKKNLHSFDLNLERKKHCITSIINVFRRNEINNAVKRDCLSILLQLSQEPEGRTAFIETDGLKFLISTFQSTDHDFLQLAVHAKTKYILANLMLDNKVLQSIFENEPSILETMFKDLDGTRELFYHPDAFNYLLNLLRAVDSLPPTAKAQQMIVIEHTLLSIEKLKYWLDDKPSSANFPIFQELNLIRNGVKYLGKTLKKRYSLNLAKIAEDPDSLSNVKLCPAKNLEEVTDENKQESLMQPSSVAPQKLSACCSIS